MNGYLAEVNMQNSRTMRVQDAEQRAEFGMGNLPWPVANLPEPKAPEEMRCRLGGNVDRVKREALHLLAFLGDDDGNASFQCGDLPVDVQHLRFQKGRAITGDDGT